MVKTPDWSGVKTLDPDAVFSISETARLLGKSQSAVRSWIHTGRVKYGKCGAMYLIPGAEIQKQIKMPDEPESIDPMGD